MQRIPTLHLTDFAPYAESFLTGQLTSKEQFRAYRLENFITDLDLAARYSRKDFLKLTLSQGPATYFCAGERWELPAGQAALVFTPANQPYHWEIPALPCYGYCAVFTASFLTAAGYASPPGSPLIAQPAFGYLSPAQHAELQPFFDQMLAGQASSYAAREEVLAHWLLLGLHALHQMQPPIPAASQATGAAGGRFLPATGRGVSAPHTRAATGPAHPTRLRRPLSRAR